MNEAIITSDSFMAISPVIALTVTGFLILLVGLFLPRLGKSVLLVISLTGVIATLLLSLECWGTPLTAFDNLITTDRFAISFTIIFVLAAGMSLLLAWNAHESGYLLYPEFLAVTLFATVGMVLMASTTHLLMIFLGLETLSISLYVLAAIKRTDALSLESAFKYFLLGAFASAFLLYGAAFVYGAVGSLDLKDVTLELKYAGLMSNPFMLLGGLLITVGLGFKVAMFPFHMWAPDVYQGAPTPVTAFMSTGSKAAGFAALLRVLFSVTDGSASDWTTVLWILAVMSMFVGNLSAILQTNIKRMLAYSSIAHAGYLLVGVVAWNDTGASGVIYYLLSYTFMNIGAFGIVVCLSSRERELLEIKDFKGLAFRKPILAVVMAAFMFSLAGLPPMAGFMGKFYLFSAAIEAGYIWLVIFAVISSMVSLYYYLGVVIAMFMKEAGTEAAVPKISYAVSFTLAIAVTGTIYLGLFPSALIDQFHAAVMAIL